MHPPKSNSSDWHSSGSHSERKGPDIPTCQRGGGSTYPWTSTQATGGAPPPRTPPDTQQPRQPGAPDAPGNVWGCPGERLGASRGAKGSVQERLKSFWGASGSTLGAHGLVQGCPEQRPGPSRKIWGCVGDCLDTPGPNNPPKMIPLRPAQASI